MAYHIDLQNACDDLIPVSIDKLISWAELPLIDHLKAAELTLRLVDDKEIIQLNYAYRQQKKATNVLAFPSAIPADIELKYPLLGDVIICPSVLQAESREQNKPLMAHWAHIIIHGVLHLLGYDHIQDNDAEIMQAVEIKLLAKIGFSNPYHLEDNHIE
jgi:probable rRNA maturation factor